MAAEINNKKFVFPINKLLIVALVTGGLACLIMAIFIQDKLFQSRQYWSLQKSDYLAARTQLMTNDWLYEIQLAAMTGDIKWLNRYQANRAQMSEFLNRKAITSENIKLKQTHQQLTAVLDKLYAYEQKIIVALKNKQQQKAKILIEDVAFQVLVDKFSHSVAKYQQLIKKAMLSQNIQAEQPNLGNSLIYLGYVLIFSLSWFFLVRRVKGKNNQIKEMYHSMDESNRQLETANATKSQFLAQMSHEIRTPMNGIIGTLDILGRTELTEHQRKLCETSGDSARHLLSIINDILDFSKLNAQKFELEEKPFKLEKELHEILRLLTQIANKKDISMGLIIENEINQSYIGDAVRLRQVMMNLLGNAIKFTPNQGQVVLRVKQVSENTGIIELRFQVVDSGIGIPEDQRDTIFDEFSQVKDSGQTTNGTGLGLSICKNLVELMEGEIAVLPNENQGCIFEFNVFIKKQRNDPQVIQSRLCHKKALVLSQDDLSIDVLEEQLTSWQVQFIKSSEWSQIAYYLENREESYDFLLIDAELIGENQAVVSKTIKAYQTNHQCIVCVIAPNKIQLQGEVWNSWDQLARPIQQLDFYDFLTHQLCPEFELPIAQSTKENKSQSNLDGTYVLLAEDNLVNQTIATYILSELGCEYDIANNGQEVIDKFQSMAKYDLILMDCQMPVVDGFGATRKVRELEALAAEGARIPIIALTANAVKGDREKCLQAGMDDYLSKPFTLVQLSEIMSGYVSERILEEHVEQPEECEQSRVQLEAANAQIKRQIATPAEGQIERKDLSSEPEESVENKSIPDASDSTIKESTQAPTNELKATYQNPTENTEQVTSQSEQVKEVEITSVLDQDIIAPMKIKKKPDKPSLFGRVSEAYLQSSVTLMDGLNAENLESTKSSLHALKSASMNVGARMLSELCIEVEAYCKSDNVELVELKDKIEKIQAQYQDVCSALKQAITEEQSSNG